MRLQAVNRAAVSVPQRRPVQRHRNPVKRSQQRRRRRIAAAKGSVRLLARPRPKSGRPLLLAQRQSAERPRRKDKQPRRPRLKNAVRRVQAVPG
ncbi:MAG TPA: hypothetical protein VGC80_04935, partial [Acetobacteraceae bacterium]